MATILPEKKKCGTTCCVKNKKQNTGIKIGDVVILTSGKTRNPRYGVIVKVGSQLKVKTRFSVEALKDYILVK